MKLRFKDEGKSVYDFWYELFIKCPQCSKFAVVKSTPDEEKGFYSYKRRTLICKNCGFIKAYENRPSSICNNYTFWIETRCCGEILWAYNLTHLVYIENYVRADLRERAKTNLGWKNNSMISRLPKWLKDAYNREEILKCIGKLKKTIPKDILNDN